MGPLETLREVWTYSLGGVNGTYDAFKVGGLSKDHTERRELRVGLQGTKTKRVHSPRPGRED